MISPYRVREMLKKELRQIFRDPRMRVVVLVAPVIQLLVFGYAVNTDVKHTATFVVDHDRTALSRELIDAITSSEYFVVVGRSESPRDLVAALDRGDAVVGIHLPVGFSADVDAGRSAQVQILIDGSDSNTGNVAQGYVTQIVRDFGLERALDRLRVERSPVDLRARALYNPTLESQVYNVPAVIGALLLLVCLLLTSLSVVREREIGTLDQLMVSPIRPVELILGKTIPVALIALVDMALISLVAIAWFGIPFRGTAISLILSGVVYILAGLSFGLLISTVSKTQQEAFMTMFLFLLPALVLSGLMYPISSMPLFFQWITWLNPMRHFLEIVRGIFLKGIGLTELWVQFTALLIMAGAGLTLAVSRFQRTLS